MYISKQISAFLGFNSCITKDITMYKFSFLSAQQYAPRMKSLDHAGDFLFLPEAISAKKTLERENYEVIFLFIGVVALVSLLTFLFFGTLPIVVLIFSAALVFYFGSLVFKTFLMVASLVHPLPTPSKKDLETIPPDDLPKYTILVPLYHEANVVHESVKALARLNYPKHKLDVRYLVEEDDRETLAMTTLLAYPYGFRVMIIPQGGPRTKPKALNVGILESHGTYLTIYDAEDQPDPDQLKKVVWAFSCLPEKVVCLQAKLTFYNPEQNLLTKWFFAEYYSWFNHFLPGLFALKLPIPLGGTSNHFKTSVLKELGAWDPYNVTEDADLGIRISRMGYKVAMVESVSEQKAGRETHNPHRHSSTRMRRVSSGTIGIIQSETMEEANSEVLNWIRQRTRWIKGYLQTTLVHLRHPKQAITDLSWKGFLSFLFFMIGTPLGHLLNLVFWTITILGFLGINSILPPGIPEPLLIAGTISLIFGNLLFILLHVVPMLLIKQWKVALAGIVIPLYWVLMSLATVRAVWQLIMAPHYWDKTVHGLIQLDRRRVPR